MTAVPDIQEISVKRKGIVAKDVNNSGRFAEEIIFEQADVLLKGTHQYARWLQLRQNNDNSARRIAETLLERHSLLEQYQKGGDLDRNRFDDLTGQLARAGIRLYSSTQVQSQSLDIAEQLSSRSTDNSLSVASPPFTEFKTDTVQSVTPLSTRGIFSEENLLILTLRCPEIGLSKDVFAYGDQNTALLPLTPLVQELDFAITIDPAAGQAKGWFISEDRTFSLDVNKKTVSINGTVYPLAENSAFVDNNEIYVTAEALSAWFPLDIDTSYSELIVSITPREKLPFQLRNERMNRNSGSSVTGIPLQYPVRPLEYDPFSLPILDVNSNIGYGDLGRDNSRVLGAYSVLAQGDLAYMGANVYVAGHEGKPVDTARIRLERVDPEGNLLGPLHANRVEVGDILPVKFPVLYDSLPERGVFLSNVDPVRSMDFDTTRFEGNLSPGWDVELYRNGSLVWTRKVGLDGRYLFEEVPLYYGKNDFVLKGFGPQGQEKIIEEQALTVGMEMLAKGASVYQVSASQREKTILGIDERNRYSEGEGGRFSARYQYGLNENMSLTSGVSSIDFGGQRHTYLQAGVSGMTSWLYGSADLLYDVADGSGLSFFGQTALGPVDVRVKQEFFSDFVMEDRPENVLKSRTEIDLSGTVDNSANLPEFSYRVSGRSAQFEEYTTSNVSAGVSTKIADIYLSNYLIWNYDNLEDDTTPLQGNFQASGYVGSLRLSGNVRYDLGDESRLNRYGVEGQWTVRQNLRAGGSVYHETADYDDRTTMTARLDWDAGFATISPSLTYNSDNEYGAFLGLSFSLGQDPVSGYPSMSSRKIGSDGSILGVVYHDKNTNAVFDEGDVLLPDVTVQAVQYRKSEQTDATGQALISGLNAYEPTDVTLDTDTLEDPFWTVTGENVAIKPRPGHLDRVEFPIVTTGVIDGTLYFVDADGTEKELVNAVLEIVDEQGNVAMTTRSEYDGFYLFERILPGDYTLRISPEDRRNAAAAGELAIPVTIDTDGTILAGTDIVLRDPNAPAAPEQLAIMEPYPLPLAAEEELSLPVSEPEVSVVKQEGRVLKQQKSSSVATVAPAPQERSDGIADKTFQEQRDVQEVVISQQEQPDRDAQGLLAAVPEKSRLKDDRASTGEVRDRPEDFADWAFDPLEGGMRPVVEYATQGNRSDRSVVTQAGPISFASPIDTSSLQPVRRINPFTYDEAMGSQQRNPKESSPGAGSSGMQGTVKRGFRAVG